MLVGHSGVGKSTLVNSLVPDAHRAIGRVNDVTGRGRHTSSSAVTLRLPDGAGWVIDTPGVRSFGLAHVLTRAGSSMPSPTSCRARPTCPRGCSHDEPECALDAWVADGGTTAGRLDSFRRLLRSRTADDDVTTVWAEADPALAVGGLGFVDSTTSCHTARRPGVTGDHDVARWLRPPRRRRAPSGPW